MLYIDIGRYSGVLNGGTIDGGEVTDIPSYTKLGHDMVSFFTV